MYVFYFIYRKDTGDGVGCGFCDQADFPHHQWEEGCDAVLVGGDTYHLLANEPDRWYLRFDQQRPWRKQPLRLAIDKKQIVANGTDVVTVLVHDGADLPPSQPVGMWVNGPMPGTYTELHLVSSRPQAYEVRVHDPRYWSEPVYFIAKQEVQ